MTEINQHEIEQEIKQPLLQTEASIYSDVAEHINNTTYGGNNAIAQPPHVPSIPAHEPDAAIELALLDIARTRPTAIQLELALNQLHKTSKVGLKVLKAAYLQVRSALEQQNAEPILTEEQRTAQAQVESERLALEQAWQEKVEARAKDIAVSADLVAELQNALEYSHGYLASKSLAGTILVSHGARLLSKSMGFVFSGPSSSGKSDGVIKASEFLPPEVVMNSTSFSERSLYYLGSISGKYILGGEIKAEKPGEDELAQQAFRQLISENRITRTTTEKDETGKLGSVVHETFGPVVFTLTTTKELQEFNDEFANRLTWYATSDDPALTAAVLIAQAESAATPPETATRSTKDLEIEAWQTYHRSLKPLTVVIPFAKQITPQSREVTIRRLFPMILNYIKALALLHQTDRQIVENGDNPYVVATLAEYEIAYELIMSNAPRVLDILSERDRQVYKKLSVAFAGRDFTRAEAQTFLKLSRPKAGRILKDLTDAGCLNVVPGKGKAYVYCLADVDLVPQDLGLIPPDQVIALSLQDDKTIVRR